MHKPVVLVVEDNEVQRKVIKLLAAEFDFEVMLAADCQEALDAYAIGGDIYSLILMDLRLPDFDGDVCAQKIAQALTRDRKRVPIIAMTGFVSYNDRDQCINMGFDDCLIKPFSSKEFQQIVHKWTRKDFNVVNMQQHRQQSEDNI